MPTQRTAYGSGAPTSGSTHIGLISDTHGWLDSRAVEALEREQPLAAILHAGDIGETAQVLYELGAIAPVTAVLGNCDHGVVPGKPTVAVARANFCGKTILVIHNLRELGPVPDGVDVVVHGHLHAPSMVRRNGVLAVNPGSASQRRRQPSCSVGVLEISGDDEISARIIELADLGPRVR